MFDQTTAAAVGVLFTLEVMLPFYFSVSLNVGDTKRLCKVNIYHVICCKE